MEEAPLLLAVQRHVGRIEVEHDLGGGAPIRVEEQLDEQPLDRFPIGLDAVIARQTPPWQQLQPVQRALAGERLIELADQHPEHRVGAQRVVVIEILVAERQAKEPLRQQRAHRVLDAARLATIDEAACQPVNQPDRFIGLLQQQRATVRADLSTVERRHHPAALNA